MSHYLEAHVVVKLNGAGPLGLHDGVTFEAKKHGFWCSMINHEDGGEEGIGDLILTTRDINLGRTRERMRDLVEDLKAKYQGLVFVKRFKIEDAILDSKEGDAP